MADYNVISALVAGVQRNINIQNNSLIVGSLKVGSASPTELTKTILDNLITLQNGSDISASLHHHDGRYFTETELGSTGGTSGADLIGTNNTPSNYSTAANTAQDNFEGIDAELLNLIKRDGSRAFTADQSMGGFKITNHADPSAAQDVATKAYVDAVAEGMRPKEAARLATTANITLSGEQTIDGFLTSADRILVKNQTDASENGLYLSDAGAWSRTTDFDSLSPIDEINGSLVAVQEGTANAGKIYVQTGEVAVLDTDDINFVFFNSNAVLVGGDGITVSGSNVSVDHDGEGLTFNGSQQLALELDGSTLAKSASGLKVATSGITANELAADSVITAKILDANVTQAKLATDSVSTAKIVDANVTEAKLATDSVSTVKIQALAVTAAKLAADSVTTVKILDANVTEAKLATDSVSTAKIQALAVTDAKLAADSVITSKILDANVTQAKLATDSVSTIKIVDDAVTKAKIAADVAGLGLSQAGDGSLDVSYSPKVQKVMVAGESFAANTSFLVRRAMNGETAGRVYKADYDTTSADKFYVIGIALSTGAVSAGGNISVILYGEHTLGSSDTPFGGTDIGKPVYLTASGAFSVTAPSGSLQAVYRVGIVAETSKIEMGTYQINGVNA